MLYFTTQLNDTIIGILKIDRSEESYLSLLNRHEWLTNVLSVKSTVRRIEKLAVRLLIKELLGEEKEILYYSSGDPYIADKSYNISISHTNGYVAVALNNEHNVGVDIEYFSDRIRNVKSRLIRNDEYINPNNDIVHLLLHFSSKESLFKLMESDEIDFINHLFIKPFNPENEGYIKAREEKTSEKSEYNIYYRVEEDFVFTCAY